METVQKITRVGVVTFVLVGAVISFAGPEKMAQDPADAASVKNQSGLTAADLPPIAHGPRI